MPSSRKTQHMGLNLWDENDYLTSHDLNADNQKIDDALAGQVTPPYIGTDGFWYVFDLSKKEYVKTAYPARGEKGAQGEPGAKGETGATGAKGDTGNPLHVAGSFDTLEQLQAAHPDGDGQNSYLVQGYVYVWNGMSWEKTNISGAGKYSDLPDKPSIGGVELTGDKSVHDIGAALSVDAFIPCVSAYDAAAKRHTLTPVQVGIVLPEVFTVRFMATAGFKAGDKVALAGVEYTPAYTDSDGAVEAGVWQVGAEVILTCRKTDKKVFVGKALENKPDKDKTFLSLAKRAKNNDLFQSAMEGELGLLQIAPAGAGDEATKNAPPGFGWGVCFAAQYGGTRQLFTFDDQGRFAFCGWNGAEWSKWQVFFQETKPITLINGWISIEAAAVCEASKFGKRVTLTLSIINPAGSSGGTIAYLPWKTKKLTIVKTGTNFLIWLVGNQLYSSGDIAANQYVTLNMSYETEE